MNLRDTCWISYLLIAGFGMILSSCQSTETIQVPLMRINEKRQFTAGMKLDKASLNSVPGRIRISKQLLSLYSIKNAYVPLRMGPGSKFPIRDQLLRYEDKVIMFESIGKWRKILVPRLNLRGWVHRGHLLHYNEDKPTDLEITTKDMPIVSAARNISRIYLYESEDKVDVKIPFSSQFIFLKQSKRRVLVWFSKLNTIAWVDKSALI